MRTQSIVSLLAVATAVAAEDAPVITRNPIGVQYQALLEGKAPWNVAGSVKIASGAAGNGVTVELSLSGLPSEGGPFMYHIHEKPVPEDGNCTATGAHLDPYKRGEVPICDSNSKQTCQTGDLSGKYGNITAQNNAFSAVYNDKYLATKKNDPSYFGDKSIVVHLANKTRIACANFKELVPAGSSTVSYGTALPSSSAGHGDHNSTASATSTGGSGSPIAPTASPTSTSPPEEGAAQRMTAEGAVLIALLAMMMV